MKSSVIRILLGTVLTSLVYIFGMYGYISAQVVINEVFPNPSGDEKGAEWVELYNNSNDVTPLNNCSLSLDLSTQTQKILFGEKDFIEKYKVITWDGTWLRNDGDTVKLECESYSDSVAYGDEVGAVVDEPKDSYSLGRNPDGIGNYYLLTTVTLGKANSTPVTPTPDPTPKPTSTPKPTTYSTPKPTLPPTSTGISTPIATARKVKQTPTPKPTASPNEDNREITETAVLGIQNNPDASPEANQDVESNSFTKIPWYSMLLIGVGILIVGYSAYYFINLKNKDYNKEDKEQFWQE